MTTEVEEAPRSRPELGAGAFAFLVVAALVVVGGLAFLAGSALDDSSQQNQFAPAVGQAFPAPAPVAVPFPPPIAVPAPPDQPPPPPPFPTAEPVPPGFGPVPTAAPPGVLPPLPPAAFDFLQQPTLEDNWHAVYGVYSCDLPGDGDAKFLPPFMSDIDVFGIHSHGDGLINVHPWVPVAAGENATMGLWFNEMRIDVSTERISVANEFDPPLELVAGEECADGTGPARIVIAHWDFDFLALGSDKPTEIFTDDFDQIRFQNDREVYIIAYVAEGTDLTSLPLPPQARFDLLSRF